MDSAIKTLLTVVFPGLAGFVIGCVVILPQLLLLGMSPSLTLFTGIVVTGLFASGVSAMLRQRYKDADVDTNDAADDQRMAPAQ